MTNAISGGAITAPTAVPPLMIPIAVARSLAGNHSVTARVAAGKPPPSPTPRSSRLAASMLTSAAEIHQPVSDKKSRVEKRFDLVGDRDVLPNRADGDR